MCRVGMKAGNQSASCVLALASDRLSRVNLSTDAATAPGGLRGNNGLGTQAPGSNDEASIRYMRAHTPSNRTAIMGVTAICRGSTLSHLA